MVIDLDGDGIPDYVPRMNVVGTVAGGECEFIDPINVITLYAALT